MNFLVFIFRSVLIGIAFRWERYVAQGKRFQKSSARPTSFSHYPFVVRVYLKGVASFVPCTGIVVQEALVMTGGRCCEVKAFSSEIVLGKEDQSTYANNLQSDGIFSYKVKETYIHPRMKKDGDRIKHDVCFIVLEQVMRGDGHEVAVVNYTVPPDDTQCVVVGWGVSNDYVSPHMLSYRNVTIFNCDGYFCVRRKASCPGDPGRALVCDKQVVGIGSSHISYVEPRASCFEYRERDYYSRMVDNIQFVERLKCSMYPISDRVDTSFPGHPFFYLASSLLLRSLLA